jgi:hypothetical protein
VLTWQCEECALKLKHQIGGFCTLRPGDNGDLGGRNVAVTPAPGLLADQVVQKSDKQLNELTQCSIFVDLLATGVRRQGQLFGANSWINQHRRSLPANAIRFLMRCSVCQTQPILNCLNARTACSRLTCLAPACEIRLQLGLERTIKWYRRLKGLNNLVSHIQVQESDVTP